MLVRIDKYVIESSFFRSCCINTRLNLVYFIHRPKGYEGELQLPVLFEKAYDALRFYTEYHNAIYNNDSGYEFVGEAWLSLEIYYKIVHGHENK